MRNNEQETIPQDVPEEEVREEMSAREQAIEAIAAKRFAELEENNDQKSAPGDELPPSEGGNRFVPDDEEDDDDQKTDRYIELVDERGRSFKIPAKAKYRGKVDGQEFTESFENLTRNYQKEKALAQRLSEAARRLQSIEARERRVAEVETVLNQRAQQFLQQQQGENEQAKEDVGALRERAAKVYRALVDEDENGAIEVIAEQLLAHGGKNTKAIDESAIVRTIENTVRQRLIEHDSAREVERIRNERRSADAQFASEYPDIVNDQDLLALMRTRAAEEMSIDPSQDGLSLLRNIGNQLREKFGLGNGPQKQTVRRQPPPAGIPSSNRQTMAVNKEEKPLTIEEHRRQTIEAIRQSRGQLI